MDLPRPMILPKMHTWPSTLHKIIRDRQLYTDLSDPVVFILFPSLPRVVCVMISCVCFSDILIVKIVFGRFDVNQNLDNEGYYSSYFLNTLTKWHMICVHFVTFTGFIVHHSFMWHFFPLFPPRKVRGTFLVENPEEHITNPDSRFSLTVIKEHLGDIWDF